LSNPGFNGLDDPRLRGVLEAMEQSDGIASKAARSLGMDRGTFVHRLDAARRYAAAPEGQRQAVSATGLDFSTATHGWIKTDGEGKVTGHSVFWKAQPDPQKLADAIREAIADCPAPLPVAAPEAKEGLCALFPVADLHIGMLADAEEVGEDWDTKIASRVFAETFSRIVSVTPLAEVAILAQLGDLTHTDDQRNVTPQSGHQLDTDSRYFMILRRAVAAMKAAIEALRQKYHRVIYCGRRGNHDMTAHYAVTLALAEYYREIENVIIVENAADFWVHEFGRNMIVLHHGDRAKPERLAHFAAAQWPEIWGRTKYRLALSGHVHHDSAKDIGGMRFESVGTIIPRDAYSYSHAYSARRSLVSITLDKDQGEISRARVNL
jgi:hypothetical protein